MPDARATRWCFALSTLRQGLWARGPHPLAIDRPARKERIHSEDLRDGRCCVQYRVQRRAMDFHLDLDQPEQPLLRHAPLQLVLWQLRFPKVFGLERSDVRPFAADLAEDYPNADVDQVQPLEVQITPAGVRQVQGLAQPVFKFQSEDE